MQNDPLLNGVNQECLEIEFEYQGTPFSSQKDLKLTYRDRELKQTYKPVPTYRDCFDKIIIELKAISKLMKEHEAQVINYLNATRLKLGLLVNFGHYPKPVYRCPFSVILRRMNTKGRLEYKRIVL